MIEVTAIIVLETLPELGLAGRVKSGLRPSFNFSDQLVACEVVAADGSEWIKTGLEQAVKIRLPYADQLGWQLPQGTRFRINVGGKIIGSGQVVDDVKPT